VIDQQTRIAFQRRINANPRDHAPQLIYADWLDEHEDPQAAFWRRKPYLVGLGGLVGLVGLGWRGGLGGRGGRGGLGGRGGRGGPLHPENQIVLIQGENAMVFIPNGYGFSVVIGHVAQEMPHGWIVDPCRDIIDTNNGDCWVELAAGKNKQMRQAAQYGKPIEGGMRVPFGCFSIPWQGDLPK
jgi:uncharacterized protein (TIGR02996 family)